MVYKYKQSTRNIPSLVVNSISDITFFAHHILENGACRIVYLKVITNRVVKTVSFNFEGLKIIFTKQVFPFKPLLQ